MSILTLKPSVQNYHWGKIGENSLAARLLEVFSPELPYAELWYGSHPSAPSEISYPLGSATLGQLLSNEPNLILGEKNVACFGETLPYLVKILSIGKALSIQAHPSKEDAKVLHSQDSLNYPDTNHKPEIAVALSKVELIHGWSNRDEVARVLNEFPELDRFLQKHQITLREWTSTTRRTLTSTLFNTSPSEIAALNNVILKSLISKSLHSEKQNLFLRLAKQVKLEDVGLLFALFLRFLTMDPGQSMFTPAGEIHAYLSGDLFECMANSDNVIRAGLTPKFQDVKSLVTYANFEEGLCPICQPAKDPQNAEFQNYYSDASEFEVALATNKTGEYQISSNGDGPEMLLLIDGKARLAGKPIEVKKGEAILIPANSKGVLLELFGASFFRISVPLL